MDRNTKAALAMLDMLKAHHPDAADASTDAELIGYAMVDLLMLAEGLRLDPKLLVAQSEAEALRDMRTFGFVDTTAFAPVIAAE